MRGVAILGATCVCGLVAFWWYGGPDDRSPGERTILQAPPPSRTKVQPADPSPSRRWTVRVNVSNPDKSPRVGATVQFLDAGNGQELDVTTTDHRGVARMNLIGAGRITVTQVAPWYPYTSPVLEPVSRELNVALQGGELSIAGRVIDSDGREAQAVVAVQPEATRQFVGRIMAVAKTHHRAASGADLSSERAGVVFSSERSDWELALGEAGTGQGVRTRSGRRRLRVVAAEQVRCANRS
jgi:hypothetical protein